MPHSGDGLRREGDIPRDGEGMRGLGVGAQRYADSRDGRLAAEGATMAFWWASQGRNYVIAIAQGSLWTCPWRDGTLRHDRVLIKKLRIGDIVFHYAGGSLRGVSRVVSEWVPAARPTGYPKRNADDLDEGWLARVHPIATDLGLGWRELPKLLAVGAPGPMDKHGIPQEKYISEITDVDGRRLLERLGVDIEAAPADHATRDAVRAADEIWDRGETDAVIISRRRREQGQLRAFLLDGRGAATCAICGRELPAALLVAAHIVPRSISDEEHRKAFASIAMLACSLGCDELFELGYLVVDDEGAVRAGRPAESEALRSVVDQLVGGSCTAHNARTAADFQRHSRLVLASPAGPKLKS